jgi:outer membrane protein assembly factor BamA
MIRAIEVEYTGPVSISRERILAQMRTKVGQLYSNEIVQDDIKALYKTGYIRNVRIFAQPQGDGVKVHRCRSNPGDRTRDRNHRRRTGSNRRDCAKR